MFLVGEFIWDDLDVATRKVRGVVDSSSFNCFVIDWLIKYQWTIVQDQESAWRRLAGKLSIVTEADGGKKAWKRGKSRSYSLFSGLRNFACRIVNNDRTTVH
jgi:hypothetical protein